MNYSIGVSTLLLIIASLLLLWLLQLYIKRQWLQPFPAQLGEWISREKLTPDEARQIIADHLDNENFDMRTLERWLAGKHLPNPKTVLRMQPLLNGETSYVQMQQTLDNGTKSYGAFVRRDEAMPSDFERLIYESHKRSYEKDLISEEDWRASEKNYSVDDKASAQGQLPRKRGRPRKKHRSK